MKNLDRRLARWINSVPWIVNENIKVYFDDHSNTGIRPRDKKKPLKYNEKRFDKVCDMVTGARWFSEKG